MINNYFNSFVIWKIKGKGKYVTRNIENDDIKNRNLEEKNTFSLEWRNYKIVIRWRNEITRWLDAKMFDRSRRNLVQIYDQSSCDLQISIQSRPTYTGATFVRLHHKESSRGTRKLPINFRTRRFLALRSPAVVINSVVVLADRSVSRRANRSAIRSRIRFAIAIHRSIEIRLITIYLSPGMFNFLIVPSIIACRSVNYPISEL